MRPGHDQKLLLAWLLLMAGFAVLAIEGCFIVYGETAEAEITYVSPHTWGERMLPQVKFTDSSGAERRESLITEFLTWDVDEQKGDTITVEYLRPLPSYVRPQGTGWFFWLGGGVFCLIGLYELVMLQRYS